MLSTDRQNMRIKNLHTINAPPSGTQNVRENESRLRKSKCKRASYWKSRVYIVKPCHVIGSQHTVYFVRNKIKGAGVVGSINNVISLTNMFPKLISLLASTIFISRTSESVSHFLKFSCITAI